MDSNISTDGVYTGRYVLIEYGERYSVNPQTHERVENQLYVNNVNNDISHYGNTYDSTVWQKVFTTYTDQLTNNTTFHEKYIMVAELNALVPKLELIEDPSATLKTAGGGSDELSPLYYGDNNQLLHNVSEIAANSPYFDEIQDTELTYKLHMPKPIELDVSKDVDYHQNKFNIYQSFFDEEEENTDPSKAAGNFIGWKPVIENENDQPTVNTETGKLEILRDTPFSKYALNMYLPAFGDILGMLYDTLFGKAAVDGGIRPYFYNNGLVDIDQIVNIDNKTALNDHSDISKILANNSEGLAGVLNALFADQSVPGETRYYVSADWLAKNTDDKTNVPGIVNKPKVVFNSNEQLEQIYNHHYYIDFSNWELANIFISKIQIIGATVSPPSKFNITTEDFSNNEVVVIWNRTALTEDDIISDTNHEAKKWIRVNIELEDFAASTIEEIIADNFSANNIVLNGRTITLWINGDNNGNIDYQSDIMFEKTFTIKTPSPKNSSTFTVKIQKGPEQNNGA